MKGGMEERYEMLICSVHDVGTDHRNGDRIWAGLNGSVERGNVTAEL